MYAKSSFTRIGLLVVVLVLVGLMTLFVLAVGRAREAARSMSCLGRTCQLTLALHNYHSLHECFPPAFLTDDRGRPQHSWRVLVLPFVEQQSTYDRYQFDEPWNGGNNQLLADAINVSVFQCPSGADNDNTMNTNFVVIQGAKTIFPGADSVALSDIKDGAENTLLLVEAHAEAIHWMEPRDLSAASMSFTLNAVDSPSINSPHPAGPGVVFADSCTSYFRLTPAVSAADIAAWTTIAQGEEATRQVLENIRAASQ